MTALVTINEEGRRAFTRKNLQRKRSFRMRVEEKSENFLSIDNKNKKLDLKKEGKEKEKQEEECKIEKESFLGGKPTKRVRTRRHRCRGKTRLRKEKKNLYWRSADTCLIIIKRGWDG